MITRMLVKGLLVLIVYVFSPLVLADFNPYSKNWPSDIASDEPPPPDPINNLPTAMQDPPDAEARVSEKKRLYVKFGVNASKTEIRHIRNKSQPPLSGLTIGIDGIQKNDISWEFGLGTKFDMARYELEYLHHRKLNYNPEPIVLGNAATLRSEVINRTLILNIYWDFDNFLYIKPYFGVLGGVVWNKTRSAMSGGGIGSGSAKTTSNYGVAWGVSVGARIPFWSNWASYVGYRYTGQSKIFWKDGRGVLKLEGQYVFSGFCLGLNYII